MKREELTALGLNDEQVNQVLSLYGAGVEKHKTSASTADAKVQELTAQLEAANTKLKGYDPDWETKAQQAKTDADARINAMLFDHELETQLRAAKARSPKAVAALLDRNGLKYNDGKIVGLSEQLEAVKKDNGYLFEDETQPPRIVGSTPGAASSPSDDKKSQFNDAMRFALFGKKE